MQRELLFVAIVLGAPLALELDAHATEPAAPDTSAVPEAPAAKPWANGDPVPAGYHVEERPRHALVLAGALALLVPYALSAATALAAKGDNGTNWLFAPVAGPFVLLFARDYRCGTNTMQAVKGLNCFADAVVVTGMIIDGALQAAGVALFVAGHVATKPELVRDEHALRIRPMRIGSGYGAGLSAAF